jgi:RNA polymerase sigma factor (sigma-70 family)
MPRATWPNSSRLSIPQGCFVYSRKLFLGGMGNKTVGKAVLFDGGLRGEETRLQEHEQRRFEQALLPHLDAAYNLARWLTRDEHEAQDLVQEAYLRALKSFGRFHGTDGRGWLLTIVRHSCYDWLRRVHTRGPATVFDEEIHGGNGGAPTPEALALQKEDRQAVHEALEALPVEFREVIVLRELEGLSYKEIAAIVDISMGTVMSRLARARAQLGRKLGQRMTEDS